LEGSGRSEEAELPSKLARRFARLEAIGGLRSPRFRFKMRRPRKFIRGSSLSEAQCVMRRSQKGAPFAVSFLSLFLPSGPCSESCFCLCLILEVPNNLTGGYWRSESHVEGMKLVVKLVPAQHCFVSLPAPLIDRILSQPLVRKSSFPSYLCCDQSIAAQSIFSRLRLHLISGALYFANSNLQTLY
jgi:hypothetical protein